jgi:hypothetical protein
MFGGSSNKSIKLAVHMGFLSAGDIHADDQENFPYNTQSLITAVTNKSY